MIQIIAQIIGFLAVGLYLLSYQFKKRIHIVSVTCVSNLLYVLQYVLLGALSGAIMDILSTVSAFLAAKKNDDFFKKYAKWVATSSMIIILAAGLTITIIRGNLLELLPIGGAVFPTLGLWCDNEQTIRKFGLIGAPFWLVYNFITTAYGAAFGSVLSIVSLVLALIRYRRK